MAIEGMFHGMEISASGLRAERLRMEVAAANVANAETTRTPDGGPWRRRVVTFAPALQEALGRPGEADVTGVRVVSVGQDEAPFPVLQRSGHPDADAQGFVAMPNVSLPMEMIDLATSARAYEANLAAVRAFRDAAEQALSIARSA